MSNVVKNSLTNGIKKRLKESFCLMDSDADGYLDYNEMKAALRALGLEVKKSYVLSVIRMYDKYNSNKISFDDFNYVVSEKLNKRNPFDEIKYAFKLFANDANGKITLGDLQELNQKLNCNLTNEEMELMITEFDTDQDDAINQTEFVDIMMDLVV
ncbi:cell division control protein 31-like [Ceratina calcarata]|uniref:Cell division control protein 31-like n=1 Tax=Ceratina calcarata TaxID=156304 RepID=A0AAJ7JC05_9HYME|nr:cell division control protein 31-like [Ceratina calcarata]